MRHVEHSPKQPPGSESSWLTWACRLAVSCCVLVWDSGGSTVEAVDSSRKGFWESGHAGLRATAFFSSSNGQKHSVSRKRITWHKRETENQPTWHETFPVSANELFHPANQLTPHIIKKKIKHCLPTTAIGRDRGQAVSLPSVHILPFPLLIPTRTYIL